MGFVRRLLGQKRVDADKTLSTSSQEAQSKARAQTAMTSLSVDQVEPPAQDEVEDPSKANDSQARQGMLGNDTQDFELGVVDSHAASLARGLRVGYISDVGKVREHNEDTLIAFQGVYLGDDDSDPFGFFVVADGMGGHQAGEVASSLAARLVTHDVLCDVYLPFLLGGSPSADMVPLTEILRRAVQNANDRVHQQVPDGGTTLTCAVILGRRAYFAHVGDSRAYLLSNHDMQQVTHDHSYVNRLIELGELSPKEAAVHPQRHVLYRAVGQGDGLDIDTYHQPLPPGSRLLLCSDGLSGVVSEDEIGRIVASAATPQEACQHLLKAANDVGGPDNITGVLIETAPD